MIRESLFERIPLTPLDMIKLKEKVDSFPDIGYHLGDAWDNGRVKIEINRRTTGSLAFEFYVTLHIKHRELVLDVEFGFNRDKVLYLTKFGYYKGDNCYGMHYEFNSKGVLIRETNFGY